MSSLISMRGHGERQRQGEQTLFQEGLDGQVWEEEVPEDLEVKD